MYKVTIRALDRPDRPNIEREYKSLVELAQAMFEYGHVSDIQVTSHTHKNKIIVRGETQSRMGPVPVLQFTVEEVTEDDSTEGTQDPSLVLVREGDSSP